jgi:hypothetical protein
LTRANAEKPYAGDTLVNINSIQKYDSAKLISVETYYQI